MRTSVAVVMLGWLCAAVAQAQLPITDGLIIELRADALAGLQDGDPVLEWVDQAQADAVDGTVRATIGAPVYNGTALYGKPVVRFNDAELMTSDLFSFPDVSAGVTLLAVTTGDKSGALHERLAHVGAIDAPGFVSFAADVCTDPTNAQGSGFRLNNGYSLKGNPNPMTTGFHVGVWQAAQGMAYKDLVFYVDGVKYALTSNQPNRAMAFPDVNNVLAVGDGYGPGKVPYSGDFVTADVAVLLVYNRVLSEAEVLEMSEYLRLAYVAHDFAAIPSPAAGTLLTDTVAVLAWEAGEASVSHTVYLSTDVNAVAQGAAEALLAVVAEPNVPVTGLATGATYYWRVDEAKADGTVTAGAVWSFSVAPDHAYNPVPSDGSLNVVLGRQLEWTPGVGALVHTVYFGTDAAEVANAAGGLPQVDPNYVPAALLPGTTCFWRVDEMTATGSVTGPVWTFTTVPDVQVEDDTLLGWWPMEEGAMSASILDMSGHGNHGVISGEIAWVDGVEGMAVQVGADTAIATPAPGVTTDTVTMTGWFNPAKLHGRAGLIFMRAGTSTTGMNLMADNQLGYHWLDAAETWNYQTGLVLPQDEWSFVAMVVQPEKAAFYLNGVTDSNEYVYTHAPVTFSTSIMLGWDSLGADRRFIGLMDDLRFYSRALNVAELEALVLPSLPILTVAPLTALDASLAEDGVNLATVNSINGVDAAGLIVGTTEHSGKWLVEWPGPNADNLDLATYASCDESPTVEIRFPQAVSTIFILERGANDKGFIQAVDADGNPIGKAAEFTADSMKLQNPGGKIVNQTAGGMAIVSKAPIYGISILPPTGGVVGIDPAVVAAIPADGQ